MITAGLRIRYGSQPRRTARAWFIAGADPAAWLHELAAWRVPHDQIRLFPVPTSRSNRQPLGVVATLPDRPESVVSGRCLPYGLIAERLFVPVEAWFDPDVSQDELKDLLNEQYTYVWHPVSGLSAFEAKLARSDRHGQQSSIADDSAVPCHTAWPLSAVARAARRPPHFCFSSSSGSKPKATELMQ